jgi:kynurenine formamidase
MCDYLSWEQSQKIYGDDYRVQIGKIERVTNTGTYLYPPFHLTAQAALLLVERGAKLVGIDSHNIDDHIILMASEARYAQYIKFCWVITC